MTVVPIDTLKIKTLREALGWTMQQAADAAGIRSRQRWNDIESGIRPNPTIDTVQRMAQALGVKVDDLLK